MVTSLWGEEQRDSITMLAMPRKRFHWIFFSLAALFLLSSGHPFNYYRLCRPVLEAKIDKLMAEKETMTSEEIEDLYMEISHLRQDYSEFSEVLFLCHCHSHFISKARYSCPKVVGYQLKARGGSCGNRPSP